MKKLFMWCCSTLMALLLVACGGEDSGAPSQPDQGDNSPTIVTLQLTPAKSRIPVGFEQKFIAQAKMSDGSVQDVTDHSALSWSSSDPAIATVSTDTGSKGLATGMAAGVVTITASGTANGTQFSATAELTVTDAVVTRLDLTPATATVPAGFDQQFTASALLSDGSVLDVTDNSALNWISSDPTIATVSSVTGSKGLATGVATGMVTITASGTANGTQFSATAELTVTDAVVTRLDVTPVTATVPAGLDQQFTATAQLSDGSMLDVTDNAALSWSSSAPAIATVSTDTGSKGLATGMAAGVVTITASGTANGTPFSATAELTVSNAVVTRLEVTPLSASLPIGLSMQHTATAFLSDGTSDVVTPNSTWSSSDPAIATVNYTGTKGLTHGVSVGQVTITASGTFNGVELTASADVMVTNAAVTGLQVTPTTASIPVGLTQQYIAMAELSDGGTRDVTVDPALNWTSSNQPIATISNVAGSKGLATGVTVGTVTITANGTFNGTPFSDNVGLEVNSDLPDFSAGCAMGTVTGSGGLNYTCPLTMSEADAKGILYTAPNPENGEVYVLMDWAQGDTYCRNLGYGYRMPTLVEMDLLYNDFGNMTTYAGWPTVMGYKSSTSVGVATHGGINLNDGTLTSQQADAALSYVSCVR